MTLSESSNSTRDVLLWDRRTALYMLHNRAGVLLYVGISSDPDTRLLEHRREQSWWPEVDMARTTIKWFPDRSEAALAEASVIRAHEPRHNAEWIPRQLPKEPPPRPGAPVGYRQVARDMRAEIRSGAIPPGQRLPTERELRLRYGVARETVRKATSLLRTEGLVDVISGWGVVVREPREVVPIRLEPGWRVSARPATAEECELHGEGVAMLQVYYPDGSGDAYPGDRTEFYT